MGRNFFQEDKVYTNTLASHLNTDFLEVELKRLAMSLRAIHTKICLPCVISHEYMELLYLIVLSEVLIFHVLPSKGHRADTSKSPMHSILVQKMLYYTRGDDKTNIICMTERHSAAISHFHYCSSP